MSTLSIVAIVPMRADSERVPGKNYRPLGDRPLYQHILTSLLGVPQITTIAIDTDSEVILQECARAFPNVVRLIRPHHLRDGHISMNDVLLHSVDQLPGDLVLQTHATNPFLSSRTMSEALGAFSKQFASGQVDSMFSVTRLQARLWKAEGVPLNHDPRVLLRTQDLSPTYVENSCFYVFPPEQLRCTENRIGGRPYMFEIPPLEALDIDEEHDFELAEALWRSKWGAHE